MSSREPVHVHLEGTRARLHTMAMRTIELLYGAEILAIVVLKDGEIAFIPRQGMEAHVAETLASIDWASAVRIVKEHCG